MRFNSQKLSVLLHILSWAVLFCIPFIGKDSVHIPFLIRHTTHLILLVIFFYLNMHVLIPKMFFEKHFSLYAFTVTFIIILIVGGNLLYDSIMMNHLLKVRFKNPPEHLPFFLRIVPVLFLTLLVLGVSTSLRVIQEYLKKEKQQKEIENEKLNAELSFLKSQINPHFLFNTLNNIYSLASITSPNTDKAILKLSDMMRYMLEETEGTKVELVKEVEYLQTYFDLQQLRLHESVFVKFVTSGDFTGKYIESLLLIPFIENAFKHGISYNEKSYILVDLLVEENKLKLTVDNSVPVVKVEKDTISGIGLNNVIKRLNLLYPDKYTLTVNPTELNFFIILEIEL